MPAVRQKLHLAPCADFRSQLCLLLPAVKDDDLLLPAVQTGGVSVASGDVNGDTDALGDPITFTFTVTNTSSAYEGSHALYQDVIVPTLDAGTLFIPPDGYWY